MPQAGNTAQAGQSIPLDVLVAAISLQPGDYSGTITVYSPPALPAVITVTAHITPATFTATPASVSLRTTQPNVLTGSIQVVFDTGVYVETLQMFATSQNGWLALDRRSWAGSPATVSYTVDSTRAMLGVNSGSIMLAVNGLNKTVPVTLEVVEPKKVLTVWPRRIDLLTGAATKSTQGLEVRTTDGSAVPFSVETSTQADWLTVPSGTWTAPTRLPVSLSATTFTSASGSTSLRLVPTDRLLGTMEIPVTRNIGALGTSIIPQIADGGGFRTRLILVNANLQPNHVQVNLYRKSSGASRETEAWFPAFAKGAVWNQFDIPAMGMVELETLGLPTAAESGWARIQSSLPVGGYAIYRQKQGESTEQEASVPLLRERVARFTLPFDQTSGQAAAMALVNSCGAAAKVTVATVDELGTPTAPTELGSWPGFGHDAFTLSNVIPATWGRRGTAEFVSDGGCVSAIGLRFTPQGAFTSVDPQPPVPDNSLKLVFPQVADGGGFTTSLVLTNQDLQPAHVQLRFRRGGSADGSTTAWTPDLPQSLTIPVGASVAVQTPGWGDTAISGWAEASSGQRVSGFAVFRRATTTLDRQEATVAGRGNAVSHSIIPFDNTDGFVSSMAVVNSSASSPLSITVVIRNPAGTVVQTEALQLPANGHSAFATPARFPVTEGISGSLEFVASNGSMQVLPLRFTPSGAFTTVRAIEP
ncbi:hypothetical protein [uncultured Paludibaculum sp.]|uniref:hypothetical protein n=1 Tax=uncultured Paludibaculum sp. TaxID=1765020 RepID=UPI002AAA83D4|nr:hypothetical protein [uncultured Paludibaculum sp.]